MPSISSVRRASRAALLLACCAGALSSAAWAQDGAPNVDEDSSITVTGRRVSQSAEAIGEDKISNVVAVTREALLSAPSGISGLKMLEQLPGFNVQTDGALGLYEFGNSVQTRAFNLDQIGFVVDGIPTGRSDAFGGSPVFRYVDNENLGVVEAAIGAGDVTLPSYSTLGPVVQYNSIAPQDEMGLFVSQSFGDNNMKRTFIRANTGQVGPFKAYVSRTKLDSDLWRGPGSVDREHWEAQVHADLGGDSWARFKFVSNDFFDYDSPTITRGQYNCTTTNLVGQCGRDYAYIENVPNTTAGFAPTTPGVYYSNSNYANVYNLAINVRKDRLYGATFHAGMADGVWAESTLYWEDKGGYGVSPDTYSNSLTRYTGQAQAGLDVTAPKGVQYGRSGVGGNRYGIANKLHWEQGNNIVEAGLWAEVDKYHRTQARYNTMDGAPDGEPNLDELVYLRRDYRSQRDTLQVSLKDTLKLMDDRLVLDLGFKGLLLDYRLNGYRDFDDYYRVVGGVGVAGWGPQVNDAHYRDMFLPMAGLLYKFDGRTQMFASYAENMALPKGMDDIYAVTRPGTSALVPQPKAERSQNMEIGVRTNQGQVYASLAGYYTKFKNRIQSITTFVEGGGASTETFYQNVGRVEAYGVEASGTYKPAFLNGLAYANANVTYNHAKFQDDIVASVTYQTAGKYIPDSAKWIVSGGVTIEPASWLVANISGKYTSKRWSTFTNTAGSSVPAYTVFSGYVDIGDGMSFGPVKSIKARFNVDNIFDKDVLSFISSSVTGDGAFRPLSPRTFQFTISGKSDAIDVAWGAALIALLPLTAQAQEVPKAVLQMHQNMITLDSHLDTPASLDLPGWSIDEEHGVHSDFTQVDLPRMKKGGLDGGFWAIYTPQGPLTEEGFRKARDFAIMRGVSIREMVAADPANFGLALEAKDAATIAAAGKRIVYMSIENAYPLGQDISLIDLFYDMGVRVSGFAHFAHNQFADSSTDPSKKPRYGGLSPLGKDLLKEMNRLGIVPDASHSSDQVLDDLLALSTTPVLLTHSGCKAIYDHPRNVDDVHLKALADKGGVIQMNAYGGYLRASKPNPERQKALAALYGQMREDAKISAETRAMLLAKRQEIDRLYPETDRPTFDDFMAHMLHALKVVGPDHVGIGLDWDGGGGVVGMEDVVDLPKITNALLKAGYSQADIQKIWSGNVLRVLAAAEAAKAK